MPRTRIAGSYDSSVSSLFFLRNLHTDGKESVQETQEMRVWSLSREDSLEKEMAPHSSILAWRIPWTEEPGGLQFMGSQRVGHNRERLTHTLKQKQKTKLEFFWNFQSLKILGF